MFLLNYKMAWWTMDSDCVTFRNQENERFRFAKNNKLKFEVMLNKAIWFTTVTQIRKDPQDVRNRKRMVKNERKKLVTAIYFMLYLMIYQLYLLILMEFFHFYFIDYEWRLFASPSRRTSRKHWTGLHQFPCKTF